MSLRFLLDPRQEALLSDTRLQLNNLRVVLARLGAEKEDDEILNAALGQLEQPFMLVVFGEFNSGKSALINALLGRDFLKVGPLPTTDTIQLLQYGDKESKTQNDNTMLIKLPAELLRDLAIVDTPGTNAIIRKHEKIALDFMPRADFVLFVTAIDRPLTETERGFMERIRQWSKKVVIVLSKIDQKTHSEVGEIQTFIETNVHDLLGFSPAVFPVSAKLALACKQNGNPADRAESRIEALEGYICSMLTAQERFRLKVLNTVNIGLRLSGRYLEVTEGQLALYNRASVVFDGIERELGIFDEEVKAWLSSELRDVDNAAYALAKRGEEFVDEKMRLGNVVELLRGQERLRAEFERRVINGLPAEIEQRATRIADWLVNADLRLRERITRALLESERLVGQVRPSGQGTTMDIAGMLRSVKKAIETYDPKLEADRIAETLRGALIAGLGLTIGGLGLGAAVLAVFSATLVDITGVLIGVMLALSAGTVIPYRRKKAKKELNDKVTAFLAQIRAPIETAAEQRVKQTTRQMQDVILPCLESFTIERDRCAKNRESLQQLTTAMNAIGRQIDIGQAARCGG
jgi:small GTP-binding protein